MMFKKAVLAGVALATLGVGPTVSAANAEAGIVRVGDSCFFLIPGPNGIFYMPFPCPREVSED